METQPVLALQPGIYHSYLVRIWREDPEMPWRASAQCVQTGETHRFATVEALFTFLAEQTAAGGQGQGAGGEEQSVLHMHKEEDENSGRG